MDPPGCWSKIPLHPSDDLLREHFKLCVLVNVKGAVRPAGYWLWLDPEIDHDPSSFRSGD